MGFKGSKRGKAKVYPTLKKYGIRMIDLAEWGGYGKVESFRASTARDKRMDFAEKLALEVETRLFEKFK